MKIPETETAIQKLREQVSDTEHSIALAKRYTDIQELTPKLAVVHPGNRGT